jgi:hypothetical protein
MIGNQNEMLANEENIVWRVKDLNQYPWVRSSHTDFTDRKKITQNRIAQLERGGKILVGYAELEENAPPAFIDQASKRKKFYRRTFTVRKNDYETYNTPGYYPAEAVETSTLQPKIAGRSPAKKK